jgi:hypothetical protein
MISLTLLNILSKFAPKEMKEFGEFVSSPFFNKNQNVVKLHTYLKKYYPEFNNRKHLEKEYVYKKLYGKGLYNDGFMRTVIHNLGRLAEDYLCYVNFTRDDLKRGLGLLEELNGRKLEKIFLKYYSDIEEGIENTQYKGPDYFYKRYLLQNEMEIYMDWSKYKNKDFKNYTENTVTYIDDELTSFYISKALNHYRFMLDKAQYENINYNYEFIDYIVDYLQNRDNHFKNKIKIKLHLYEILLEKRKEKKYYDILKEILISEKENLSQSDRYSLHNILQTHCINMAYSGENGYLEERFELYKICIQQKLYAASEHIYFDDLMFGNIAITAISLKELDWAEKFISKYKGDISPENSEVVINYVDAKLCFARGNCEKTLEYLNGIKSIRHIQYKLPVKDLMLMTCYELKLMSQAFYQADSYRHFLANNKSYFSDSRFKRVSNFLKAFTRLAKIADKNNPGELKKLKSDIEASPNIPEKNWILQKIHEISG